MNPHPAVRPSSRAPAKAEARAAGGGGGSTASSLDCPYDSPYDSPYQTPVKPRRMLVLPISHKALKMAGLRGPRGLQMDRGPQGLGAAPESTV